MTFEELELVIQKWANDREITAHSSPRAQLLKAVSELGELCDAEIKNDLEGVVDGVGDVLVCLIIYCQMMKLSTAFCLKCAYFEIKDRKGRMVEGGAFVKE